MIHSQLSPPAARFPKSASDTCAIPLAKVGAKPFSPSTDFREIKSLKIENPLKCSHSQMFITVIGGCDFHGDFRIVSFFAMFSCFSINLPTFATRIAG